MIFIVLAVILGLGLGFFSFYHLNLFLAGSTVFAIVGGVVLRLLAPFSAILAREMSAAGQGEGFVQNYLNLLKAVFHFLPEGAQTGLILLPAIIVIGRFLTWAHYVLFPDHALPLTEEERREATLQRHSFKAR